MLISGLSRDLQRLCENAIEARTNAQAPYSKYHVGAAVLVARPSFKVFRGCNIERANYTSTSHAEQTAIDSMVAECGPIGLKAIAVVGAPAGKQPSGPVWPCGHCRGIIWENALGKLDVKVISIVDAKNCQVLTIGELYPHAFGPEDLRIKIDQLKA